MSSKLKGSLSKAAIKDQQVKLTSASTVIQTYVQIILEQPDLKLSALSKLPAHQATARNHGNNWNSTILSSMAKTVADIIDYANKFESFYEGLVKFTKDVKDSKSKASLVDGLKLLSSTTKQKDANAEAVVKILTTFHMNLNTDYENFSKDVQVAAVKIKGDKGEIKALNDQLAAIHDAMDKDIGLMAGGAVAIVGGAAMIVFGAVSEIPSGGASTALIGGGVVAVSGGVVMETIGGRDYSRQIEHQRKVSEKLEDDQLELVGLNTTNTQVSGFVKGLESAITAAAALKAGWQALDADLDELITAVNNVDPKLSGPWFVG